jgi:hypothetical protein
MGLSFDASFERLFVVTFTGEVDDDEYEAFLRKCERTFSKLQTPYVLVYDARAYRKMGPLSRQMQSAWINRNREKIRAQCRGVAFILASRLQRGVLAAAHMVSPPPYPYKIFGSLDEGQAWCAIRLKGSEKPTLAPSDGQVDSGFNQLPTLPPGEVSRPPPRRSTFTQRLDLRTPAAPIVSSPRKSWK